MTKVILAGTGVPSPNPKRMGLCIVVINEGKPVVFDCGRGALIQLVRAKVDPAQVEQVFLTHHHFDHTIGLPDLLLGSWMMGRNTAMQVFGPAGTSRFVHNIMETFKTDIESRRSFSRMVAGSSSHSISKLEVSAHEIDEGLIWEDSGWKIQAIRVDHIPNSLGYRIDTSDRSIVFSGDTRPHPPLVEFARGADVLIHEVIFSPEYEATGTVVGKHKSFVYPNWFNRMRHTRPHEVGDIAQQAGIKKLVLTHLWSNSGEEELRKQVAAHFSGEIVVGRDLLEV